MYERFTDRARKIMQLAKREAERFQHEYIGTEHILLGLIAEGSGVAANVLKNLDVSPEKIHAEVTHLIQYGPEGLPTGTALPQTPRAKKVIQCAIAESRNLGQNYVGTEHLLLGLLAEGEGVAAQALMHLGLTLDKVRAEVRNLLGLGARQEADTPTTQTAVTAAVQSKPPAYAVTSILAEFSDERSFYKRFTDEARAVMQFARDEARDCYHEFIGTEHILLGVVRQQNEVVVDILKDLGIDLRSIRKEVDRIIQRGPRPIDTSRIPLTPRAKRVLEFACHEAPKLGQNSVGPEHLLFGLLQEEEGVAAQILLNFGLCLAAVRRKLLENLGHAGEEAPAPTAVVEPAGLPPSVRSILDEYERQLGLLQISKEAAVAADDSIQLAHVRDQITRLRGSRDVLLTLFRVEPD